jgi:hypothetical protein
MWILHRRPLHRDPPVAFTSAIANLNYRLRVFAMCKVHAHEMCLLRRRCAATARACVRRGSRAVGLGPNGRPELGIFVSGEYLNERTNKSNLMSRVCHQLARDARPLWANSRELEKNCLIHCKTLADMEIDLKHRCMPCK